MNGRMRSDRLRTAQIPGVVNLGAAVGADEARIIVHLGDLGLYLTELELAGVQFAVFLWIGTVVF
jgi:hypothetical protein